MSGHAGGVFTYVLTREQQWLSLSFWTWCRERGQGLNLSEQDGAMAYAAPEVLAGRRPTEKADM